MLRSLPAVFAVLILSSSAFADARSEIQAAYDKMCAGFMRKDAGPLIAMLANDFTNSEPGGTPQKRDAFIKDMKGHMASTKKMERCAIKILKFSSNAKSAVADVRSELKMLVADSSGMFGAKGKDVTLEMDMVDRESWVRAKSGWLLKKSVSLPGGKFLVNGKPMGSH